MFPSTSCSRATADIIQPLVVSPPVDAQRAKNRLSLIRAALMLPFFLSNVYCLLFTEENARVHLIAAAVVVLSAVVMALVPLRAEAFMLLWYSVGLSNELFVFGPSCFAAEQIASQSALALPWLSFAVFAGVTTAAFSKQSERGNERGEKSDLSMRSLSRRMNLMQCYIIGVWSGSLLQYGPGAILPLFGSVFFLLAVTGWLLLLNKVAHTVVGKSGASLDMLSILQKLADTSFLRVVVVACGGFMFTSFLMIPTFSILAARVPHTLLSAVAIVVEIVLYGVF